MILSTGAIPFLLKDFVMSFSLQPKLPLPSPLRGTDPASFAHYTVIHRFSDLTRRVMADNDFSPAQTERFVRLLDEFSSGRVRPLKDSAAPDAAAWREYLAPYLGQTWLEIPWFLAEVYFYRRILEASGYFEPGPAWGIDPCRRQKEQSLASSRPLLKQLCRTISLWLEQVPNVNEKALAELLAIDLWGNRVDLSMWPIDGQNGEPDQTDFHQDQAHLLVDHTGAVIDHLLKGQNRPARVDFIIDNAGFELVCDLALVDFLLTGQLVSTVTLNLKAHPTYISDAMIADVEETLRFLVTQTDPAVKALAGRLSGRLKDGRLILKEDYFWNSPLVFWQMPEALRAQLAQAHLVISKGDANYRRFLGDLHWDYATPFHEVVSYFPAPLVLLRTLKSEIAAGLEAGRVAELNARQPDWIISGEYGVVQFVEPEI